METDVRWTIKVSKETDRDLHTYLAQKGMKKGDLSNFVQEAVQERLFKFAIAEVRAQNADVPAEEIEAIVNEAVAWARKDMREHPPE